MTTPCPTSPFCPSRPLASGGFAFALTDVNRPPEASVLVPATATDPGYYLFAVEGVGHSIPVPNAAGTGVRGYAANLSDCAQALAASATVVVDSISVPPPINNITVQPAAPAANNITVQPAAPPTNNITVQPPANNITVQPAPSVPAVNNITVQPAATPVNNVTVQPPVNNVTVQPATGVVSGLLWPDGSVRSIDAQGQIVVLQPAPPSAPCPSVRMASGGFLFHPADVADPLATVSIEDCNGVLMGYAYPTAAPGHTLAVMSCATPSTVVGYAANRSACAPDYPCTTTVATTPSGDVLETILSGLVIPPYDVPSIANGDTLQTALEKLQGQIDEAALSDSGVVVGGTTMTALTTYYHDRWVVYGGGVVTLAADLAMSGRALSFVPGDGEPDFTIAIAPSVNVIQRVDTTLSSANSASGEVAVFFQEDGDVRVMTPTVGASTPGGTVMTGNGAPSAAPSASQLPVYIDQVTGALYTYNATTALWTDTTNYQLVEAYLGGQSGGQSVVATEQAVATFPVPADTWTATRQISLRGHVTPVGTGGTLRVRLDSTTGPLLGSAVVNAAGLLDFTAYATVGGTTGTLKAAGRVGTVAMALQTATGVNMTADHLLILTAQGDGANGLLNDFAGLVVG